MINIFKITGMSCNHCVKSVEEAVKMLPVERYDVTIGSLYVEYDSEKVTKEQIIAAVEDVGYEITSNS